MTVDGICFFLLVALSLVGLAWCGWDHWRPRPPMTPEQERADLHSIFLGDHIINATFKARRRSSWWR
jgi:hypothetical protein